MGQTDIQRVSEATEREDGERNLIRTEEQRSEDGLEEKHLLEASQLLGEQSEQKEDQSHERQTHRAVVDDLRVAQILLFKELSQTAIQLELTEGEGVRLVVHVLQHRTAESEGSKIDFESEVRRREILEVVDCKTDCPCPLVDLDRDTAEIGSRVQRED